MCLDNQLNDGQWNNLLTIDNLSANTLMYCIVGSKSLETNMMTTFSKGRIVDNINSLEQ